MLRVFLDILHTVINGNLSSWILKALEYAQKMYSCQQRGPPTWMVAMTLSIVMTSCSGQRGKVKQCCAFLRHPSHRHYTLAWQF